MNLESNVVPYTPFFAEQNTPAPGHELEHPAVVLLPGNAREAQDTLNASDAILRPARYCDALIERLEGLSKKPLNPSLLLQVLRHKKLARLRNRPAARLLAGSVLSLKAYSLDMDCPPSLRAYVREQLRRFLRDQTGKALSPDALSIAFSTDTHSAVQADGREDYRLLLSLTDIGLASFSPASFLALITSAENDQTLDGASELTAAMAIGFIIRAPWLHEYKQQLDSFWIHHGKTWCSLAKLAFLDGIAQQLAHKKLSLDGYRLALDALGLQRFPDNVDDLEHLAPSGKAMVSMFSHNGLVLPGIFQLKSRNTAHCFIHVLGEKPVTLEYISDELDWMKPKLIEALNAADWLAPCLNLSQAADLSAIESIVINGDLFSALSHAQYAFLLKHVEEPDIDLLSDPRWREDELLLKPVERSLTLVSALDLCETQPDISKRIPNPLTAARRVMRQTVKEKLGMTQDPDQVFIRYLRGTSITPLGNARNPANHVQTPSEKPISLSEALLTHYRVEHPVGYLDNGGRTAVYLDTSGQGQWSQEAELAISAESVQRLVEGIDFLTLMSSRLERFWDEQGEAIEQTLKTTFIAQAMLALKLGHLTRSGFDLLVDMLDMTRSNETSNPIQCKALGFYLQSSLIEGTRGYSCAGLLLFSHPAKPLQVLYQAGQQQTFVEFNSQQGLDRHLEQASKSQLWRTTLANYLPISLQPSLQYVLEVWAGQRTPGTPSSDLRPWTHVIYANHLHKAEARAFCEQGFTESPFAFMRRQLQQNHQDNADDQIVTSKEVSLRYWGALFNHLQLLLMPMSLLLTPAAIAALAARVGSLGIDLATAGLPGNRGAEKKQLVVDAVLFGLLDLGPMTSRLLRAFRVFTVPVKTVVQVTKAAARSRSFGSFITRSVNARRTRLEPFFNSNSLLKTWGIPGHPGFGTLPLMGWKLGHKFLLWTSHRGQARTLVVSTHGYYLPWTKTTAIPNGTELRTYAPHGFELVDPGIHRVVSQRTGPFSLLTPVDNTPVLALPAYAATDKVLAGTSLPGRIKNYTLSKFQNTRYETYQDIHNVVRNSNQRPWHPSLPTVPMDVLTVRNRFGMSHPNLEDLFKTLSEQGIHYDRILLLHCRCSAISSLMGLSPSYRAPSTAALIPSTP